MEADMSDWGLDSEMVDCMSCGTVSSLDEVSDRGGRCPVCGQYNHDLDAGRHHTASRKLHTAADEDYRDSHQAPGPEDGAPMHDVTQGIYPASFYDEPFRYWGTDESTGDRDSWGTIHKVRGNPDARVKVHRALPLDVAKRERGIGLAAPLNTGDWVTPSYNYAHEHGMSRLEGNTPWTVVTSTVPASQLHTNGDSLAEWGYNGPPTQGYEGANAAGKRKYRQQQVRKQQINAETTKDFHHCGFCGSPSGEPCERGCWGKKKYPGERDVRGDLPGQPGVSGGGEIDYDPGALRDIRLSHRSADGIRYAHIVEADVADDLTKLAADGWQPPQRVDLNLDPDEVLKYADPGNVTEPDKLEVLRPQIQRSGITTPVILTTDGSRAELNDGHHRAEIARQMGISVPVQVWPESSAYFNETHSKTGGGLSRWLQTGGRPAYDQRTKTAMPWYHRTDDELNPGDHLLPYNQVHPDHQEVGDESWNPNKAYVYYGEEDDSSDHAPYAGYGQHIYEIEPHDDPQRDYGDGNHSSHMTDGGTVIKRLPDEDPYSFGEEPQWADPIAHKYASRTAMPWSQYEQARNARLAMPAIDAYDPEIPHEDRDEEPEYIPSGPWYHGSDHELSDGLMIQPGGGYSKHKMIYQDPKTKGRDGWVWMAPTPNLAKQWGEHVYEVDPHDEGPWPWNGERSYGEEYVSPRARVVRKLHPDEAIDARFASRTAMPAPLPKGTYFRYHPELVWSPGVTAHLPGGKQVGSLEWYDDDHVMVDLGTRRPGEIDRIQVPEDHRGQSIATSMFDFAKQHEPRLHHSDILTEDGRGWSEYEQSRKVNADRLAGLRGELPKNLSFQHHPVGSESFSDVITPTVSVSTAFPTVSAHDGDKMIGYLQWNDDHPRRKGEIWDLRVHPDYQRRGVATALYDYTLDQIEPNLRHSDNLSDEGRAFVEAEDARPLARQRDEAWRNDQPMPKRFAMPTVYHGTDPENAQSILQNGFSPSGWGGKTFFSTEPQDAASYGDSLLSVDIPNDEWERTDRHPWMHHETAEVDPHRLQELGIKPRLLDEVPRRPLTGPPVWPKVYRKNNDQTWQEGRPVDQVARQIDTDEDLTQMRDVPDWPKGTFDAGAGTYWDVDFGDGPTPVHQRDLYT